MKLGTDDSREAGCIDGVFCTTDTAAPQQAELPLTCGKGHASYALKLSMKESMDSRVPLEEQYRP